MAELLAGQTYCGEDFDSRWNQAWNKSWSVMRILIAGLKIDQIPQDLYDDLLAWAFWRTIDCEYKSKIPPRVNSLCTLNRCIVPNRPRRTGDEIKRDVAALRLAPAVEGQK